MVGGYAAFFTPQFTIGLARVLLPFTNQAPYHRTHIQSVKPGDAVSRVVEGQDLPIEAVVDRGIPDNADLYRRTAGGDWRHDTVTAADGAAGVFRWKAGPVLDSFDYYIAAGDARSDTFHVEAIKRPRVERIAMNYTYPPYLGSPDKQIADSGGEIKAVTGTTVRLELHATKPLQEAALRTITAGEKPEITSYSMVKSGDDPVWTTSFTLSAPGARLPAGRRVRRSSGRSNISCHMVDEEGTPSDSAAMEIKVMPDQPPVLALGGVRAPKQRTPLSS